MSRNTKNNMIKKLKSQNITRKILKDSSSTTDYETSKYYDRCRDKIHGILTKLKHKCGTPKKKGGLQKLT